MNKYGLNLYFDVKSSVPRLTYFLNNRIWLNRDIDLYFEIYKEYNRLGGGEGIIDNELLVKSFSFETREALKYLFMSPYFEEHSLANMQKNVRYKMYEKYNKEDVYRELELFEKAIENVLGQLYHSEIFYYESCVYMDVLQELLEEGFLVWQVYDCWYARKDDVSQEEFS